MRRLFSVLLLSMLLTGTMHAQEDRFSDYTQLPGKDIIIYDIYSILEKGKKLIQIDVNGKLKPYTDDGTIAVRCTGIVTIKKKQYVKGSYIKRGDFEMRLYLKIDDKVNYLDKIRNLSYWKNLEDSIRRTYKYIYYKNIAGEETDKYKSITWFPMSLHWNNIDTPYSLEYRREGNYDETLPVKDILANIFPDYEFRSQEQYDKDAAIEKARKDSIEAADRERDKKPIIAIVKNGEVRSTFTKKHAVLFQEPVCVYAIERGRNYNTVYGFYNGEEIDIADYNVIFSDSADFAYLERNAWKNRELRVQIAKEASKRLFNKRVAEHKNKKTRLKTDEMFLKKIEKNSSGDFIDRYIGTNITIYNCWNKTIKYIYFTALPINEVGDVEKDYRGNTSAQRKLIGPIEPGAMYEFRVEELFYYDSDIKKLALSSIMFEFTDRTARHYEGAEIKRHMWMEGDEKVF